MKKNNDLWRLFWPLFFEAVLVALVSVIDVAMVSWLGDGPVGAVGASNTYLNMINTALSIISVGAQAVMSQHIGAGSPDVALRARRIGLIFNTAFGAVFSVIFLFFSTPIHRVLGTANALLADASVYLMIVGASCIFFAATNIYSAYLRAVGRPRDTLIAATVGNLVNLVLNALFIYLGYGVAGVAMATLIARVVTLVLSAFFAYRVRAGVGDGTSVNERRLLGDILSIGLPAAGESLLWSACISLVMFFLNRMDEGGIAVSIYSYCNQLIVFTVCFSSSFERAAGIIVGWRVGAGDPDGADREVMRALRYGLLSTFVVAALFVPFGRPLLSLLTDSEEILSLVMPVMAIEIIRSLGKLGNCVVGTSLKTAGDATMTLIFGIFVMPTSALIGAYLLGTVLGLGVIGAWIGLALDEGIRCFLMYARWKSRKWVDKAVVKS